LFEIETDNIALYGFGVKSYTLSMIEAAVTLSDGEITANDINEILKIGQVMLESEFPLLPCVKETLETLSGEYPLMVITKGDLLEQTTKVNRSGLTDYFSAIEVVSTKSQQTYHQLMKKYDLNPETFVMVGNSLPSDIQPVLSLGGTAIHVPADTTWAHELMDDFDSTQKNFYEIEHIGQLTALLPKIK
jgi:putative hydrolase of the HAD superfamily